MQIFFPFADVKKSAKLLDRSRLFKQIIEVSTILDGGWPNHAASRMYVNHTGFLTHYYNTFVKEYENRGYKCSYIPLEEENWYLPPWYGNNDFHLSHLSNLKRKALNDAKGISASGGSKKPTTELLENMKSMVSDFDNLPSNLPYIWYRT